MPVALGFTVFLLEGLVAVPSGECTEADVCMGSVALFLPFAFAEAGGANRLFRESNEVVQYVRGSIFCQRFYAFQPPPPS